ncbi:DUF2218 domain-containing protein [Rhizobium sp. KVB221]|uniref:DUF2218 domain-containing protein n=1 Tax=Rhizobium setariae TaxID=2801340 RepID=A0A937CNV0_9HYPH|nr:DUF2218 domain-containing protein [Rhizobium setariae]MBL0374166.1 DUF2218 domain-containing protein [Rhizobium setariae]
MAQTSATVTTEHASKYLQQLCKHWSHKMTAEFDAQNGRIDFPSGAQTWLTASPDALQIRIEDGTTEDLERLETVVADHLKRFAFREELEFVWKRQN